MKNIQVICQATPPAVLQLPVIAQQKMVHDEIFAQDHEEEGGWLAMASLFSNT